jgi:hypothetical protein
MKFIFIITICISTILYSQIDEHGNPIFNSSPISEDTLDNYILSANYYTITNNIDNDNSSVFVDEDPSSEEILEFTRSLPSYFFMVHKNNVVSNMIMVLVEIDGKKSIYRYNILNPKTNKQKEIECNIKGDVTELRAIELIEKYPDKSKEMKLGSNSMILFENIIYSIQGFEKLKKDIIEKISKYKLYDPEIDISEL